MKAKNKKERLMIDVSKGYETFIFGKELNNNNDNYLIK